MADRKRSTKKDGDDGLDHSIESFRNSLEHTVTVSRERLQEVLDDAVSRGRMTRRDAEGVVSELLEKGRKHRDQLIDELEKLGRQLGQTTERVARQARDVTEKPLAKAEQKLRRGGGTRAKSSATAKPAAPKPAAAKKFPIAGYDELNAKQVQAKLAGLSAAELRTVREHEKKGAARKTVLAAIEKKLG